MKNNRFILLAAIILLSISHTAYTQSECTRMTHYGSIELCLPSIEGMKECYLRPNVKALADHFEDDRNLVLAYYVNDSTFLQADRLAEIKYDDYFKIYANKGLGDVTIEAKDLQSVYSEMSASLTIDNWQSLKEGIEEKLDDLQVGVPQLIEEFKVSDKSKSMTLIINYIIEGEMNPVAMSISILVIKERLLFVAYYLGFKDEETFELIKLKSKQIIERIEAMNLE